MAFIVALATENVVQKADVVLNGRGEGFFLLKNIQAFVKVEELTFSDGRSIKIGDSKLIILVGPNNAGKSASLREIESRIRSEAETDVVTAAKVSKEGSAEAIGAFMEAEFLFDDSRGKRLYTFAGGQIWSEGLKAKWNGPREQNGYRRAPKRMQPRQCCGFPTADWHQVNSRYAAQ